MMSTASIIPVALLAALASTATFAGAYLESADNEPGSKTPSQVSKLWFEAGRMRSETTGGDGGSVAIFKNKAMYVLDPRTKSYRVIDKVTVDRMAAQLGEARKKMEAAMAGMPPERRAMMEKMMGQMGGAAGQAPKRVLKNTGRTETVAGVKCAVWEATVNGQKEEELCAAAPGALPGGEEMLKTLREVGDIFKGFTQSFSGNGRADNAWRDLETVNGVPILTRELTAGKVTSENRLNVARKESVPAAQFEVPAGYTEKKLELPGMPAGK